MTDVNPGIATPELDPKRCNVIRDNGDQCKGHPTKTGKCAGHSGLGIAANPATYAAIGNKQSATIRHERARLGKLTATQVYREAIETHAQDFVKRRLQIVKNGSDADALRAMDQLEARALGRPTEIIEQRDTNPEKGLSLPDLRRRVAELDRLTGEQTFVTGVTFPVQENTGLSRDKPL